MAGPHFSVVRGKYVDYIVAPPGGGAPLTGVTTAAWVAALDLKESVLGERIYGAIFWLTNLSAPTTTMKYKIVGYLTEDTGGQSKDITSETTISTATMVENLDANHPYARIIVYVMDGNGHASYSLDYKPY